MGDCEGVNRVIYTSDPGFERDAIVDHPISLPCSALPFCGVQPSKPGCLAIDLVFLRNLVCSTSWQYSVRARVGKGSTWRLVTC